MLVTVVIDCSDSYLSIAISLSLYRASGCVGRNVLGFIFSRLREVSVRTDTGVLIAITLRMKSTSICVSSMASTILIGSPGTRINI